MCGKEEKWGREEGGEEGEREGEGRRTSGGYSLGDGRADGLGSRGTLCSSDRT